MDVKELVSGKTSSPRDVSLRSGDTARVSVKIKEAGKERLQTLQGVVIRLKRGATGSFTIRHVAYGVGVEHTFPFESPMLDKVEVLSHGKVRRAKLYYLRELSTKRSRIKERRTAVSPAEAEEAAATRPGEQGGDAATAEKQETLASPAQKQQTTVSTAQKPETTTPPPGQTSPGS